jgi:hypothetical protein
MSAAPNVPGLVPLPEAVSSVYVQYGTREPKADNTAQVTVVFSQNFQIPTGCSVVIQ